MKIVSNLLEQIEGIQIYYIVGLLIFFTLFMVIFIRTMRRPDKEMEDIKKSILVENDSDELSVSNN